MVKNISSIIFLFVVSVHVFATNFNKPNPSSGPGPSSINLNSKFRLTTQALINLAGGGTNAFNYDVVQQAPGNVQSEIIKRSYTASITTSQFGVAVGLGYRNFNVGLTLVHERIKSSDSESIYTRVDGSTLRLNDGDWPNSKTYFGPFLAYDFEIGKNIYLTPNYQYTWYNYQSNGTFLSFDTFSQSSFDYNGIFINRKSNIIGLQLKFGLGINVLLFVEGKYVDDNYTISQEYLTEEIQNEIANSNHVSIGFGVQMNFFQY